MPVVIGGGWGGMLHFHSSFTRYFSNNTKKSQKISTKINFQHLHFIAFDHDLGPLQREEEHKTKHSWKDAIKIIIKNKKKNKIFYFLSIFYANFMQIFLLKTDEVQK